VRVLATILTLTMAAFMVPSEPAIAMTDSIVSASDPSGDVAIRRQPGISTADRESIDLRRLVVERHGNAVRFGFRIGRLERLATFTQAFFVDLMSPDVTFGQLQVATHPLSGPYQGGDELWLEMGIENPDTPQGFVSCRRLDADMRDGARRFWVDVPTKCLPSGRVGISVYSQTMSLPEGGSAFVQYSHDRLRLSGRFDLGGAVQPQHN
jgi:hypothetical protein